MDTPRFDPSPSVEFNLARGLVKIEGGAPRLLGSCPEKGDATNRQEEGDHDHPDAVAPQEVHQLCEAEEDRVIALVAALFYG